MKGLVVVAVPLALMAAVTAPPQWREDKQAGIQLAANAELELKARGASAAATAQVFVSPDQSVLYVTLVARKTADERDATAREIVDTFLGAPKRAELTSTKVSVTGSSSRLDTAKKQIEATLQWQDDEAGYQTRSRLLIVGEGDNLVSITGECLLPAAAPQLSRDACDAALATLDPEISADKRVVLALATEGTAPTPSATGSQTLGGPTTMSDGGRTPLPPMIVPGVEAKRTVDRRPVYVGAGIVVLAGLFWWNRRRRDRLEGESASKSKKDSHE